MPLIKSFDTEISNSIKTTFHVTVEFSFNAITRTTLVNTMSYISAEDALAGKAPYLQRSYLLNTVDPSTVIADTDLGITLEQKLVKLIEEAIVREVEEFSGAQIVGT